MPSGGVCGYAYAYALRWCAGLGACEHVRTYAKNACFGSILSSSGFGVCAYAYAYAWAWPLVAFLPARKSLFGNICKTAYRDRKYVKTASGPAWRRDWVRFGHTLIHTFEYICFMFLTPKF